MRVIREAAVIGEISCSVSNHTVFARQYAQLVAILVVLEADGARLEVRALRVLLVERAHRQLAQVGWT